MVKKIRQELRVTLCQNKFILIMSDNFDRKVCSGLQSTKKLKNIFFFINFTGSPLYEEFLGQICHGLLYFAILIYINEL